MTDPNSVRYMKDIDKPIFEENPHPRSSNKFSDRSREVPEMVPSNNNKRYSTKESSTGKNGNSKRKSHPQVPTLELISQENDPVSKEKSEREKAGFEDTFAKK